MTQTPALTGKIINGQYRLDACLGGSPLGEQYRAWDLRQEMALGLIFLPPELNTDPEALPRLEAASAAANAAAALKNIRHPRLIPFLGVFPSPEGIFLLEAWHDGPTLADILRESAGRPLSLLETQSCLNALGGALEALHQSGRFHPMLAAELIHINAAGEIALSLAPCALPDETASPGGEVYALAALAHQLLTGAWPPPPGSTPREINPEIPDFVSRILLKGLAPRAAERIPTAREFIASLAMAAQLGAASAPNHFSAESASLTGEILARWHYLPAPQRPPAPAQRAAPLAGKISFWQSLWQNGFTRLLTVGLPLVFLAVLFFALNQLQPIQNEIGAPAPGTLSGAGTRAATLRPAATFTLPAKPTKSHGGRIYFTCTRGDYNQLCVINADGSGYNQLTSGPAHNYYPAVAPQGGMLVYASNRGGAFDLYLLLFQSGQLLPLTDKIGNVVSPDFSPDGESIVFANRAADGPTAIWMVDRAGKNPRLVYAGPNTIVATAWSPDGKTIAFAMSVDLPTEYQIFLMDTNGQNVRQISHGLQGVGGSLDWSPDGKSLLIYAGPVGDKDIFRLEVATGLTTQLTRGGNNAASSYSPDGQYIVFNSLRNNDQADLFIMRADGSELRQLTDNSEPDWQPHWEP
ncbi:MAG: hypothetical protein OHK0031_05390 [Anaerolineales bacterium]